MDDFVWLKHRETGGYFHSPAGAVDDLAELGWETCEAPPEEVNPAVAEQLAWRQRMAAESQPTETATRGKSKEMSDG